MIQQIFLHHVHKIRRAADIQSAAHQSQRLLLRFLRLLRRNQLVFDHRRQNVIPRFNRAVRMLLCRRIVIWPADNSRQESALLQIQLAHILAEISLRRFAKSVNRKTSAIAKINFVGIKLEDLLLGVAMLQLQRHHRLGNFAMPGALRGKEKTARQLHVQRAGALRFRAVTHVRQRRTRHANRVKSRMLEKTLVLRGQQRVHQIFRQVRELHRPPLLARLVEKIRQQFRFNFRAVQGGRGGNRANGTNLFAGKLHPNSVSSVKVGRFRRINFQRIPTRNVISHAI